jgi:serine protease inhibitor
VWYNIYKEHQEKTQLYCSIRKERGIVVFKFKKAITLIIMVLFIGFIGGCTPISKNKLTIVKINDAINPDYSRIENLTLGDYDSEFISIIQNFCAKSAQAIIEESDKNIVISPVSYYMTLAMLSEMTNDLTFEEILGALEMPSLDYVRTNSKLMYEKLFEITSEKEKLLLGNSLWIDNQFSVEENLLKELAEHFYLLSYHGDLQSLDTATKIKEWVDSMTGNLIKSTPDEFLGEDSSVLMLFNTIYFENQWLNPFSKSTIQKPFFLTNGESLNADFMFCNEGEKAYLSPRYTSYHKSFNQGYSMQFVLPKEGENPFALLSDLALMKELLTLSNTNKKEDVSIAFANSYMPKFKYRFDTKLIEATKKLGINEIFNRQNQGFKKVNQIYPLFVTEYKQKAYIELDQNGVKAAAVTQVTMDTESVKEPLITLTFDRPFLYVIYDKEHIPLFIGIVNNPLLEE